MKHHQSKSLQNSNALHFPIGRLLDMIKGIFAASVPDQVHIENFNSGLSNGQKLHITDAPIGESAFKGEGYENGSSDYRHFINVNDNYLQFAWMLAYVALAEYDLLTGLQNNNNVDNAKSIIRELRIVEQMFTVAKKMLARNSDEDFMAASRGEIFRLPNSLNKRNEYVDKVDTIVAYSGAYLLLHEYAHFHFNHEGHAPAYETEADKFAVEHLIGYCMKLDKDKEQNTRTAALGILLTMLAAAYVNPQLVSATYPDIDKRAVVLAEQIQTMCPAAINAPLGKIFVSSIYRWCSFAGVNCLKAFSTTNDHWEQLQILQNCLTDYKRQFRIM